MLAATNARWKWAAVKKKWTRTRRAVSTKQRVTSKKFLEVSRCSRAKERQKNVQKVCCTCKVVYLLVRPIVVFHRSPALPSRLAWHDFKFCMNKLLILSRASLLALAKSIYYIKTKEISRSFQSRQCIYNTDMRNEILPQIPRVVVWWTKMLSKKGRTAKT